MTFRRYKIGELGKVVTGKTPSTHNTDYWDGDFPFITIPDLNELPFVKYSSRTLSQLGATAIKSQMLPENSVLMSCIATVGKCGITTKPSFTNQQINAVIPNDKVNPLFLLYLFRNLGTEMSQFGSGGTVYSNISKSLFESIEVQIPESLVLQSAIARILSVLDAKIAINNELSKTSENIARAIFKSWFIDFDPVKAKMAGEKPSGMDTATAKLFPNLMEESELGLIPKGWDVRSIGDSVIKQKVGKLFDSKTSATFGSTPILDQGKSGVVGYHNEEAGVFASPDAPLVVFANHTCSLRIVSYPFSVIQNVFPLIGNQVDVMWMYFAVEGKQQFDSYKGHWPDFVLHKIIQPTEQATQAFRKAVEPLLKQKWLLEEQSKILADLRDSLLPRLFSGELQIPEEMVAS